MRAHDEYEREIQLRSGTVILTTSDAEIDILKSYQLHANGYLAKAVQLAAFEVLVIASGISGAR